MRETLSVVCRVERPIERMERERGRVLVKEEFDFVHKRILSEIFIISSTIFGGRKP